jgi:hypothetical protein
MKILKRKPANQETASKKDDSDKPVKKSKLNQLLSLTYKIKKYEI